MLLRDGSMRLRGGAPVRRERPAPPWGIAPAKRRPPGRPGPLPDRPDRVPACGSPEEPGGPGEGEAEGDPGEVERPVHHLGAAPDGGVPLCASSVTTAITTPPATTAPVARGKVRSHSPVETAKSATCTSGSAGAHPTDGK